LKKSKKMATQDPTKAMQEGLDESAGLSRTIEKTLSNFTSIAQEIARPLLEGIKSITKALGENKDRLADMVKAMAVASVASAFWDVLVAIKDVGFGIVGLQVMFGLLGEGGALTFGAIAAAAATAAATIALITVGTGGIAAIIWAGNEAYKAWEKAGESIEKTDTTFRNSCARIKAAGMQLKDDLELLEFKKQKEALKRERDKYKPSGPILGRGPVGSFVRGAGDTMTLGMTKKWREWVASKKDRTKYNEIMKQLHYLEGAEMKLMNKKHKGQEKELKKNMEQFFLKKEESKLQGKMTAQQDNLVSLGKLKNEMTKAGNKTIVKGIDEQIKAETQLLAKTEAGLNQEIEKNLVQNKEEMGDITARMRQQLDAMPTPITTTKVSGNTGRTTEKDDTVPKDRTLAQINAVENISNMLSGNPDAIGKLVGMLSTYLPRIAEGGQKSLSPTANQWT